jgi:dephospho-CoA kinase
MAKAIIVGPQCSGKTALAKKLKSYDLGIPIIDEDDEIIRRNGGIDPSDWEYKWQVLRPAIQRDILAMGNVIFFTSFFDVHSLLTAKKQGFSIVCLDTSREILEERNKKRIAQGVDDASYGWTLNLPYHNQIRKQGLADLIVCTDVPLEESGQLIVQTMNAI